MIALLAAACTYIFQATATGLEKGAPVEFLFVSKGSDRDYEALFIVDESVETFCKNIEKAGIPAGKAVDGKKCILWPVGVPLSLEPKMADFINTSLPDGYSPSDILYTGGARDEKGALYPESSNSHCSIFALYSLAHSPLVFSGIYPQGDVYGAYTAKKTLKKGEKVTFRLTWDGKTKPLQVQLDFKPGNAKENILKLKSFGNRSLDVLATFSGDITVSEAKAAANALQSLDSVQIKINGTNDNGLFYRAFLPLVKWSDRSERLLQPFELTLGDDKDELLYIEEDWSGESLNPKLTPKKIYFADAKKYKKTTTCFIYAKSDEKLSRIYEVKKRLAETSIINWYIFEKN